MNDPPRNKRRRPQLSAANERHERTVNPEQWTTTDQAGGLFMLGLIYALVLVGLAFGVPAAGHDRSRLFLAVCIPGLIFWPAAGVALAFGHRPTRRWVGPAILLVQYLLMVGIITSTDGADHDRVAVAWSGQPRLVIVFAATFLAGQMALWFFCAVKRREATGRSLRDRITLAGAMLAVVIVSLLLAIVTIPAGWIW